MSIRKVFEEELAELKTELVEMCYLTEQMIGDAITALVNRDRELGKSIGDMDKRVDEYEMAIEKKCMRILLKQQPVAKDFRVVSTALKMITDIERFGDQAADIGDLVSTMPGETYIKKLTHITAMGDLALKMVRDSVNSFINNDEPLADEVIRLDDEMDELFLTVKNELIELIKVDANNGDQAIELMMVAKYLERIGDHAVNVAEWTKYNETGVHQKF
ncbi:MAG: phosphate signaling complex protein PhoU [Christensenellales bacterium]|nr:phosphate signaling complex protein PhoU [Clostridium sp.]MDY2926988.1 phosphate signaling complex protein PhoU [Eubacteriales bacterium]MCI7013662.1 phosphate signaling complex protein PhoU [Clostridium sp.]MDD5904779.1 phosphate signaling complex protein PhoU [Clostridium sp.]MDD5981531.1 phosphate signaling complex protein PhoU [Clostridium sp.]